MNSNPYPPSLPQVPAPDNTLRPRRRIWKWIVLGVLVFCLLLILTIFGTFFFFRKNLIASLRFTDASQTCIDLYKQAKIEPAIAACTEAIAINPKDANSYAIRGYLYFIQNQYKKAIADCDSAIKLDPTHGGAYLSRGLAYERMKEVELTLDNYNEMLARPIKQKVDMYYGYINRGITYLRKDERELAIQDYLRAISEQPDLPEAYTELEKLFLNEKLNDELIVIYTRLIERNPNVAEFTYHRGAIYRWDGQMKLALADFKKCLTLNPSALLRPKIETQIRDIELLIK